METRQRVSLHLRNKASKRRENGLLDSIFRRHADRSEIAQIFVQFCIKDVGCTSHSCSGPICIASLGRFFLKFRRHSVNSSSLTNLINWQENKSTTQYAMVHIVEERSSFTLYFYMPPDIPLPYRIENLLQGASIKYYQKVLFSFFIENWTRKEE